jgi:hypothetical protein
VVRLPRRHALLVLVPHRRRLDAGLLAALLEGGGRGIWGLGFEGLRVRGLQFRFGVYGIGCMVWGVGVRGRALGVGV